jgi:hypothetical protein
MFEESIRGKTAIAGIGETTYYKWGKSPDSEFKLTLDAILAACRDAGLAPQELDGFASFSNDRNTPARLASALNVKELKHASMVWGGGRDERRGRGGVRAGERRRRLPRAGAGPVPALRPGRRIGDGER